MYAFEWDPATDVITRLAETDECLGTKRRLLDTGKRFLSTVYPEDRERFRELACKLTSIIPSIRSLIESIDLKVT